MSEIQELLQTISLYLHIPFCHTRCHYCDFNTYAGILPLREPYVRALITEVELAGQLPNLQMALHAVHALSFSAAAHPVCLQ